MTKTVLLATAAVLALSVGASAGTIALSAKGFHAKAHKIDRMKNNASNAVLYDQNSTDSGVVISSQNFESSFDVYDDASADDFVVPGGHTWRVREVDVTGQYFAFSGPSRTETVTFYKNKKGRPGAVISSDTVAGTDNFGSFTIPLTKAGSPLLRGGKGDGKTYWVSVVSDMDFGSGGQWGWETQLEQVGNPAQWQNPGGGFGVCPTWEDQNVCIPDGQGDNMFTLRGGDHS